MTKKVIIISGGSRGLGAAIAQHLLETGYVVGTFSRSETDFTEKHRNNPNFYWAKLDLRDNKGLREFVSDVYRRFGGIYGLINNAGVGTEGILATMNDELVKTTIDTNLGQPIALTKLVVKKMLCGQGGCIVNISSVNAIRGHNGVSVYGATKAGLDGFTRGLAKELGPKKIRVNSICPGYFESEMVSHLDTSTINRIQKRTPLGRLARPDDIANLTTFLLGDGEFITGQIIAVDGGITC